jgi:NAD(P)-dependent dehydrogenase (short-subunit alcohol dehydrogenase family)
MTRKPEGKVAIVTGAGAGIGEVIAHKFAREGAKVVVSGLPNDPINDVACAIQHYAGVAIAYPGDVAEEAYAKGCVEAAIQAFCINVV